MKKIFLIAILSIALMNCNSDDSNPTQDDFETVDIEFTLIGKGSLGGEATGGYIDISQQNIVISDEVSWEELINFINSTNSNPSVVGNISDSFLITDVDFENYQLIVVIDEVRMTWYDLSIISVVEHQDNIVVTSEIISSAATVTTQPFCIVQIPKSDKPVVFEIE